MRVRTGAPRDQASLTRRWVTRSVIVVALLTLVGIGLLWPSGEAPDLGIQPTQFVDAEVTDIERTVCDAVTARAQTGCDRVAAKLTSGPDEGDDAVFLIRDTDFRVPELSVGDRVVLLDVPTSPTEFRYTFSDFQRSTPMWWLFGLFIAAVVAVGRWQGVRALAGLAGSGLVIFVFLVPSLIRNESAVMVALTASAAIAFLAFYLAHGVNPGTTVALAGTLLSLVVITLLALVATEAAALSGLASEEAQALRVTASALDLRGLLVAGIVIGALGVLDDVTVTQVSTVAALKRANPRLDRIEAYRGAMRVGRDHVASVVNTLILAYTGAALPLVLLFSQGSVATGRLLTSEIVSVEIIRMLVGSIGLILSVPITTALAAAVLSGDEDIHAGHDHGHGSGAGHGAAGAPELDPPDDAPKGHVVRRHRIQRQPDESPTESASWDNFSPRDDPV